MNNTSIKKRILILVILTPILGYALLSGLGFPEANTPILFTTTHKALEWTYSAVGFTLIWILYSILKDLLSTIWKRKEKQIDLTLKEIESHPLYGEFLQSDPENRYIYKEQTQTAFEKWLKQNSANKTVDTIRVSARRNSNPPDTLNLNPTSEH